MGLFGTSGIRGIYGSEVTPELSLKLGRSLAAFLKMSKGKKVVIGHDQRKSSPALSHAIISGLNECGADTLFGGLSPTPSIAYATKVLADAGVSITASHNPPEYNGIKFWNKDGSGFSREQEGQIESLLSVDLSGPDKDAEAGEIGEGIKENINSHHIEAILKRVKNLGGLKVVVNCNCGSASAVAPELLKNLGCKVTAIFSEPDGSYRPGVEYRASRIGDWGKIVDMKKTIKAVRKEKADIGICYDGDADRVFVIDSEGKPVSGDDLMCVIVGRLKGDIVTIVDASMSIEEVARGKVYRTKVGDVNVSNEVKNRKAVFGGEAASGAFVWPELHLCPDGIFGSCKILEIASRENLSELVKKVPRYPMVRDRIPCRNEKKASALQKIKERVLNEKGFKPKEIIDIDGIRVGMEDAWFLIRPSGTEEIMRITVEAKDERKLEEVLSIARKFVDEAVR